MARHTHYPLRTLIATGAVAAVAASSTTATSTATAAPPAGRSVTAKTDPSDRRELTGAVSPRVASAPRPTGAALNAPQEALTFRVYLDNPGEDEAARYAAAVSTPGDPSYGKFLTPEEYHRRFAPPQSQVDQVSTWLRASGFEIESVPANRRFVEASGTVAQAETAFATHFENRRIDGRTIRATTVQPSVPAALRGVATVVGLDETQGLARPAGGHEEIPGVNPPAGARDAQPCSDYWGERTVRNAPAPDGTRLPASPSAFAPCGYTPRQIAGAYKLDRGRAARHPGEGVTVGVLGVMSSSTLHADVNTWSRRQGVPPLRPGQLRTSVAPARPGDAAMDPAELEQWAVEQTMDVQAVRASAPAANIRYYGARDSGTALDALLNDIVERNEVDILSNSYSYPGEIVPQATMEAIKDIHVQAAAQGMTVLYASGDGGDETYGSGDTSRATPNWPASSPYATAVGGTSMGIGRRNRRIFEVAWQTGMAGLGDGRWSNPAYTFGSGGGASRVFPLPDYQRGVVPDALSTAAGARNAPMRTVPDVSALGDPSTGMVVGQTLRWPDGTTSYGEFRSGGTSLAAPLYAGIIARVNDSNDSRLGFANPALYRIRAKAHDVVPRSGDDPTGLVRVDYRDGSGDDQGYMYTAWMFDHHAPLTIHTRPGYDDTTGTGSPGGPAWFNALSREAR